MGEREKLNQSLVTKLVPIDQWGERVQLHIDEECRGPVYNLNIGKQGGIWESQLSHLKKDGSFPKQKRMGRFLRSLFSRITGLR